MRSKNPVLMEEIKIFAEEFYLKNFKSPTKVQIAQALDITPGTVSKYLTFMKNNGMVEYDGYTVHTKNTRKYNEKTTSAAILGSISCGPLLFEDENVADYIALPQAIFGKGEFYILKANGDSMKDAGIDDGDWVVIKKQNFANEGDIIVALVDGANTLKYFFRDKENNCAVLRAANKNYDDILANELIVQGVATQIIKKV